MKRRTVFKAIALKTVRRFSRYFSISMPQSVLYILVYKQSGAHQ